MHLNDHSEEQMLEIVRVTEDPESLERYLKAERERTYAFAPRPAVLNALIEKLARKSRPSGQTAAMREIFESYGSSDPDRAAKFKAAEAQCLESANQLAREIQERDEVRARMFKALNND